MFQYHLKYSGDGEENSTSFLFDRSHDCCGVRVSQQNHGSTTVIEWRGQDVQTASVKEWGEGRSDVAVPQPPAHLGVDGVPGQHTVRKHGSFGNACCAGGIE